MTPCQCLTTHLLTYLKGFCRGHGHGARRAAALRRRRARRRPARQGRRRASAQAGLRGGRPGSARPIYRVLRPAAGGGRWRQVAGEIWYFWVGILGCGTHLVCVHLVLSGCQCCQSCGVPRKETLGLYRPLEMNACHSKMQTLCSETPTVLCGPSSTPYRELFWYGVPQGRWLPSPRP